MTITKISTTQLATLEQLTEAEATAAVVEPILDELIARMWNPDIEVGITADQRMIVLHPNSIAK